MTDNDDVVIAVVDMPPERKGPSFGSLSPSLCVVIVIPGRSTLPGSGLMPINWHNLQPPPPYGIQRGMLSPCDPWTRPMIDLIGRSEQTSQQLM